MKKPSLLSRLFGDERNYERPFFLFLSVFMVAMFIWALTVSPALDSAWKIALFTVLMIVYISLFWISPLIFARPGWLAIYLIVHGLVAFSMGMLVQVIGIAFGFYPGLIGLAIGIPVRRVWRFLAVGYILALSLSNYIFIAGSGAVLWWAGMSVPIVLFIVLYVSLYLRQAEARERAQALLTELEQANRQLREYAAQVEDLTIANERQRMARDLHDTLSQGLAGLILQLEAVDAHLAGSRSERARSILQNSMEKARLTLADARRAIDDLRRTGELQLEAAVLREVEHFQATAGIPCQLELDLPDLLPEAVIEIAVRVVSEGLENIARHARANQTSLRIVKPTGQDRLEIDLQDDGIGFDPDTIGAGHYGLLGMRERIRLAGGTIEIHSGVGQGSRLSVRLPLQQAALPQAGQEAGSG
jgi:NarL family two-component system sensor histidine kinase YdfH